MPTVPSKMMMTLSESNACIFPETALSMNESGALDADAASGYVMIADIKFKCDDQVVRRAAISAPGEHSK